MKDLLAERTERLKEYRFTGLRKNEELYYAETSNKKCRKRNKRKTELLLIAKGDIKNEEILVINFSI